MEVSLVMFKPNGQRKDFPLLNPRTILGRAESCDLRIPLLSVSRRHCELGVGDEGLTVRDLASSNGTYVNNERVNEAELNPGDRLVVGPVVFTVQIDGQPEEIQPVKTRGQVLAEQSHAGADDIVSLEEELAAELGDGGLDETNVSEFEAEPVAEVVDPMDALAAMGPEDEEEQEQQAEQQQGSQE
jgi:pSer/pThr/pTyr-binding forkhead associated (FHA) protein